MANKICGFKFWCYKILPTVYDDSLSYYELLCRVVNKLNEVIDGNNKMVDSFEALKGYVDNYFSSLDVQEEINKKLDDMANSGVFDVIVGEYLGENGVQKEVNKKVDEMVQSGEFGNIVKENIGEFDLEAEVDNKINEMVQSGEFGDIVKEYDPGFIVAGSNSKYFVDSENGNDDNPGTEEQPFKTLERAFKLFNKGVNAQISFVLMGDGVYTVPASIYVIWQGTPHFYSKGGTPTLKFEYGGGVGPRFYSCHVNFTGTAGERIKVDSAAKCLYFEGCTVASNYVDFLVPIRVLGGYFLATGSSFTTIPGSSPSWPFTYRPALLCNGASIQLTNTTIKNTDGVSSGIMLASGSTANIYGNITTVEQVQSGNNAVIFVDSSFAKIAATFIRGDTAYPYKYLVRGNASLILCTTPVMYDEWVDNGLLINNTSVLIDSNVIRDTGLRVGTTLNYGNVNFAGHLTTRGTQIVFTVPLMEKPTELNGIKLTFQDITIRAPFIDEDGAGGYLSTRIPYEDIGEVKITADSNYFAMVTITLSGEYRYPDYNNCPVDVRLSKCKLIGE